ncbi:hypothetical protein DFJ74DRAFT_344634 [Hyaloraphidium curvatum]|nr:hypothetical protein DFJ74DRAFT_344634 [Hyaloraphidium curvatum]
MVRLGPRAILRLAVPLVFISFPAFAIWTRRAGSGGAEPDEDANPLPPGHETPTRPADVLEPTIEIHSPEDASLPARGASKQRLWGFKEVDDLEQELGQRGEAAKPPEPEAASKDSEDATAVKADAGQKGGIPGERPAPVDVPHSLNMPRFKFGQAESGGVLPTTGPRRGVRRPTPWAALSIGHLWRRESAASRTSPWQSRPGGAWRIAGCPRS